MTESDVAFIRRVLDNHEHCVRSLEVVAKLQSDDRIPERAKGLLAIVQDIARTQRRELEEAYERVMHVLIDGGER